MGMSDRCLSVKASINLYQALQTWNMRVRSGEMRGGRRDS